MKSLLPALFAVTVTVSTFAAGPATSVYAIRDARIYTVAGPVIPRGTVVIRNGLIEAVGAGVPIPSEATVIQGNGLTVYPGLIDSFTDTGLPNGNGAPEQGAGGGRGAGPPPQQQQLPKNAHEAIFQTPVGLNADRMLGNQVVAEGKNVEASRNLGITSALTVSRDGLLTGQSALINTGDSNIVVKSP